MIGYGHNMTYSKFRYGGSAVQVTEDDGRYLIHSYLCTINFLYIYIFLLMSQYWLFWYNSPSFCIFDGRPRINLSISSYTADASTKVYKLDPKCHFLSKTKVSFKMRKDNFLAPCCRIIKTQESKFWRLQNIGLLIGIWNVKLGGMVFRSLGIWTDWKSKEKGFSSLQHPERKNFFCLFRNSSKNCPH